MARLIGCGAHMSENENKNPKMKGTNIIDCIPQVGECPLRCDECYYNSGRFYRTLDEPLIPTLEEAKGKIVRINSGHDSNIQRDLVIRATKCYEHKFYNTSLSNFDFPAPVVFTCNGRELHLVKRGLDNLMFVRVRTSVFNMDEVLNATMYYLNHNVPVVLTFMRYYDISKIPISYRKGFVFKKHILNSYYCHTEEMQLRVLERFKGLGVCMCGTPVSSLCVDCRNCEFLYWEHLRKS